MDRFVGPAWSASPGPVFACESHCPGVVYQPLYLAPSAGFTDLTHEPQEPNFARYDNLREEDKQRLQDVDRDIASARLCLEAGESIVSKASHVTQSEGYLDLPPEMRERVYDELLKLKNVSQQELDVLKQGLGVQTLVEPLSRARASGNYKQEREEILADYRSRVRRYQDNYQNLLGDFADDKMELMQTLTKGTKADSSIPPHVTQSEGFLDLPPEMRARIYDQLLKLKNVSEQELDVSKQGLLDAWQQYGERSFRAMNAGNYYSEHPKIKADFQSKCDEHEERYDNFLRDFADDKMELMQTLTKGTKAVCPSCGFMNLPPELRNTVLGHLEREQETELRGIKQKQKMVDILGKRLERIELARERQERGPHFVKIAQEWLGDAQQDLGLSEREFENKFGFGKMDLMRDLAKRKVQSSEAFFELPNDLQDMIASGVLEQRREFLSDLEALEEHMRNVRSTLSLMEDDLEEERDPWNSFLQYEISGRKLDLIDLERRYEAMLRDYQKQFAPAKMQMMRDLLQNLEPSEACIDLPGDSLSGMACKVEESKSWLPAFVTRNRSGRKPAGENHSSNKLSQRAGMAEIAVLYNQALVTLAIMNNKKAPQTEIMAKEKDVATCETLLRQQMLHLLLEILLPQKVSGVDGQKVIIKFVDGGNPYEPTDSVAALLPLIQERFSEDVETRQTTVGMPQPKYFVFDENGNLRNKVLFNNFWKMDGKVFVNFKTILDKAVEEDDTSNGNQTKYFLAFKKNYYALNSALCLRISESYNVEEKELKKAKDKGLRIQDIKWDSYSDNTHGKVILSMARCLKLTLGPQRHFKNQKKQNVFDKMKVNANMLYEACSKVWEISVEKKHGQYVKDKEGHFGKRMYDVRGERVWMKNYFRIEEEEPGRVYCLGGDGRSETEVGMISLVQPIKLFDTQLLKKLEGLSVVPGPTTETNIRDFQNQMAEKIISINQRLEDQNFFKQIFTFCYEQNSMKRLEAAKPLQGDDPSFVYLIGAYDSGSYHAELIEYQSNPAVPTPKKNTSKTAAAESAPVPGPDPANVVAVDVTPKPSWAATALSALEFNPAGDGAPTSETSLATRELSSAPEATTSRTPARSWAAAAASDRELHPVGRGEGSGGSSRHSPHPAGAATQEFSPAGRREGTSQATPGSAASSRRSRHAAGAATRTTPSPFHPPGRRDRNSQ